MFCITPKTRYILVNVLQSLGNGMSLNLITINIPSTQSQKPKLWKMQLRSLKQMSSYSIEMNDTNLDLVPNNRRTSDTELGISSTGSGPESGAEHRLGSRTRLPMAHGAATRPTAAISELGTHPA